MDLLTNFKEFLELNGWHNSEQRILLAVSGGVDSVVLTYLFWLCGRKIAIAHCNFGLRGEESDGDAVFVKEWSEKMNLPYYEVRFDTVAVAATEGWSIQEAARELRYRWLEEIRKQNAYDFVALAHHLNDSIETFLYHLSRGTGLKGLVGMPLRRGAFIRPLLFTTRQAIEDFASEKNLNWREDSSNSADLYTRNFIRRQIVPLFRQLNPEFSQTMSRTMRRLKGIRDNFKFLLAEALQAERLADGSLLVEKVRLERFPDRYGVLTEWLRPLGFTQEQVRQLDKNWMQSGLVLPGSQWKLWNDRASIRLSPLLGTGMEQQQEIVIQADDLLVSLPGGAKLILMAAEAAPPFPDGKDEALLDADKLQFPLKVRYWKAGDTFQPFGMGGQRQKVQDFLTNNKISRLEKQKTWVITDGTGAIIWLPGYRIDQRFAIDQNSQRAIKLFFQAALR